MLKWSFKIQKARLTLQHFYFKQHFSTSEFISYKVHDNECFVHKIVIQCVIYSNISIEKCMFDNTFGKTHLFGLECILEKSYRHKYFKSNLTLILSLSLISVRNLNLTDFFYSQLCSR